MKSLNSIILSAVTLASLTTKADALDYANVNALFYSIPKYKQIIELNEDRWTKKFKDQITLKYQTNSLGVLHGRRKNRRR
jgi:hypothetical protein